MTTDNDTTVNDSPFAPPAVPWAAAALDLVFSQENRPVANHSARSWAFARLLRDHLNLAGEVDESLLCTIGSRIVAEALQRGHTVTAAVRDPAKLADPHSTLMIVTRDVLQSAAVTAAAKDQDVVISSLVRRDVAQ
jgi:hypothetical protein